MSMEEQRKRRSRRKFTEEFKARAVRLVLTESQTVAQVARDLDLSESVLAGWVTQTKVGRGVGPARPLTSDEREELGRLRKENRILSRESAKAAQVGVTPSPAPTSSTVAIMTCRCRTGPQQQGDFFWTSISASARSARAMSLAFCPPRP